MTTNQGLSSTEAAARLKQYGPNTVVTKHRLRPFVAFLKTFNSPLLWIIIFASAVSFIVGERTNAIILAFMLSLSVILDYVNTSRSEQAVQSLTKKVVTTVTAIRDGQPQSLPLTDIVPGDVVTLTAGNVIPADGWVIADKDFFVNQSALTGESLPVVKQATTDPSGAVKADNEHCLMLGTSVVSGYGTMLVGMVGAQTAFGKIADRLTRADTATDFDKGIRSFSVFLMRITFVMVSVVFILNAAAHRGWLESFIFAVAIAIGLTPELLPVILTVSLSRGAVRMSKQRVIVKHLPAIQNFGRMDILCTDKTGTLTENRISVVKYIDAFGTSDERVLRTAYLNSAFHSGVANPLDDAIRTFRTFDVTAAKKIDEIPFDFERRRESIVVQDGDQRLLITKGAPEAILPICTRFYHGQERPMDAGFSQTVTQQFTALSQEGYRVLSVASRPIKPEEFPYDIADERDMMFVGFIALLDPPKKGVKESIDQLEALGIGIKILTGDSLLLTEKICRDIDVPLRGSITGDQLRDMDEAGWRAAVANHSIFARIDPEQKEKIISHLQQAGHVVGFLGDGINDAPALKVADVGVSVSNAVDVAKETADIILLEHSLDVLKNGVIEGRKTFHNTLKYIMMVLSSNFGNMFSMTVASAFLPFLPMLPTQILLNNFLYDSSQLTLSTDNVDDEDVQRPTAWNLKFIQRFMFVFGPVSSIFDFLTFGTLLYVFHLPAGGFQTGWFLESIASQVLVIFIIRTRRSLFHSRRPSLPVTLNTIGAVAVAWLIPYLAVGRIFHLQPLPALITLAIAGIVTVDLLLVEAAKHWFYRRWQLQAA